MAAAALSLADGMTPILPGSTTLRDKQRRGHDDLCIFSRRPRSRSHYLSTPRACSLDLSRACRRGPLPFPGHAGRKSVLVYCSAGRELGAAQCWGCPWAMPGQPTSVPPWRGHLTSQAASEATACTDHGAGGLLLQQQLWHLCKPSCSALPCSMPGHQVAAQRPLCNHFLTSLLLTAPCSWEQLWELSPLPHPVSA